MSLVQQLLIKRIHKKLEDEREKVSILHAAIDAAGNADTDDELFNGLQEAVDKTS